MLDTEYLQCSVFAISEPMRCVLAMLAMGSCTAAHNKHPIYTEPSRSRDMVCAAVHSHPSRLALCDAWCCVLAMLGVCSYAQMFAAARMCTVVKTHVKSPLKDRRDRRDRHLGGGRIMCVLVYLSIRSEIVWME